MCIYFRPCTEKFANFIYLSFTVGLKSEKLDGFIIKIVVVASSQANTSHLNFTFASESILFSSFLYRVDPLR